MASLLEVLVTFVAAVLILALIAQSVQEIIKVVFAIKGATARKALEGLLTEGAQAEGLLEGDGEQMVEAIVKRLAKLGQDGVRPGALRLDKLSAPLLAELIRSIDPASVASLKPLSPDLAAARLDRLAVRAHRWFPLAMDPVDDRYRRRMRGLALLSAALVVVALNADALDILHQARQDSTFRDRIQASALRLDSLDQRARAAMAADSAQGRLVADSARTAAADLLGSTGQTLFGGGKRHPERFLWWIGIVSSILLVSLGAPFWHDALEALFGVKNRIRAQAEKAKAETPPTVATAEQTEEAGGVTKTKVVTKPVDELK